ncbi:ParB/RepB/Spo0J family partition protein [Leucobacter triazinivorans]|uniref:Chromosome partitioning protein ParB n=1 Tax=Leucobacter triazinivorans TaxID=1784719 RepID=A0A4P6KD19_9MICO|nr:ParB N-terminal domain-containing protein [Leucobacter triazinivorans]QBE48275.1 chromosome partitioning protein ParB [Leucobacter triazinivorans]
MSGEYGLQLERSLDSMRIVDSYRVDTGDIDELARSMDEHGILQLPTITPDGMILLGERRYLAARRLSWRTMPVYVRAGLSDRLGMLLSRQADHLHQKPLNPVEAARLYRELKLVLEEEAAKRKAATQFGAGTENGGFSGGRDSRPPETTPTQAGKSARKAAQLITGRDSSQMLERVCRIEDLAEDATASAQVREQAAAELELIRGGAGVNASHLRMNTALTLDQLDQLAADPAEPEHLREQARAEAERVRESDRKAAEMERLAQEALARVKRGGSSRKPQSLALASVPDPAASRQYSSRSFLVVWGDLDQWWLNYDPKQMAHELNDEDVAMFIRVVEGSIRFMEQLNTARSTLAA